MTQTIDMLEKLVAFPTVSAQSNLPMIDFVHDFLAARGFAVHRIDASTPGKAGLFARIGPEISPGVMLSAHSDVVPVAGQDWSSDPFKLRRSDGKLFGRGATDMKGFLAASLALADRLDTNRMSEALKLSISWDEEVGCRGIPEMLPHLGSSIGAPRLCIVGEPTSMQVACGHKSKSVFRADCRGVPGHSAMAPHFVNALHLATGFITRLQSIQALYEMSGAQDDDYEVPYSTLHVGKMTGGTALNIVPEHATVEFEARLVVGDGLQELEERLMEAARESVAEQRTHHPDVAVTLKNTGGYPGLAVPVHAPIVAEVAGFASSRNATKVGYGTEAGHFANAGIDTVICGPGSMEQGHIADEFISIDQLAACDAFMERLGKRIGAIA